MSAREWVRPRRLLLLHLGTIAVLSCGVIVLGWQLVQQEAAVHEQRVRDRLETAADLVTAELRQELLRVEGRLDRLGHLGELELESALLVDGPALPPQALYLVVDSRGARAYPARRLAYRPEPTLDPESRSHTSVDAAPSSSVFETGEAMEFRDRDLEAAADFYRRLIESDSPSIRGDALLRLARVQRKRGRVDAALDAYRRLEELGPVVVAGKPAALVAVLGRCRLLDESGRLESLRSEAERLRRALVDSGWRIRRATFLHALSQADAWLAEPEEPSAPSPPDGAVPSAPPPATGAVSSQPSPATPAVSTRPTSAAEGVSSDGSPGHGPSTGTPGSGTSSSGAALTRKIARRIELAEAVERWIREDSRATGAEDRAEVRTLRVDDVPFVAVSQGDRERKVVLIGGPELIEGTLLQAIEELLSRRDVRLTLVDGSGSLASSDGAVSGPRARRSAGEAGLPWTVLIGSADPEADAARLAGRRRLLWAASCLIVALALAGSAFSVRAVARETEAARLRSAFLAAVSHDFRTPLTSLRQVTEALVDGRVDDERRDRYHATQLRATSRLQRLVEGLLDLGRMEDGAAEFERVPIPARAWLDELVREFRAEVAAQGSRLEADLDLPPALRIQGDREALTRAIWNLLDNALKYSADCRTVWIDAGVQAADESTLPSGEALVIRVRDLGIGVPADELDRIFEKFIRGSNSGLASGTGLGLTMVRHIVVGHGGEVSVRSEAGRGSTFVVRLAAAHDRGNRGTHGDDGNHGEHGNHGELGDHGNQRSPGTCGTTGEAT